MTIPLLAIIVRVVWIAIEWPLVHTHERGPATNRDRSSGRVWDIANAMEPIGLALGFWGIGRWSNANGPIAIAGLAFLVLGAAFRLAAISTLGGQFTSHVMIRSDHHLVRRGLYRYLRHPAYTGSLVAHFGLGLSFSSWASLGFSTVPFLIATVYRISVEEKALSDAFGAEYAAYRNDTKRLIPWVY